jgi:hypothetical protein
MVREVRRAMEGVGEMAVQALKKIFGKSERRQRALKRCLRRVSLIPELDLDSIRALVVQQQNFIGAIEKGQTDQTVVQPPLTSTQRRTLRRDLSVAHHFEIGLRRIGQRRHGDPLRSLWSSAIAARGIPNRITWCSGSGPWIDGCAQCSPTTGHRRRRPTAC